MFVLYQSKSRLSQNVWAAKALSLSITALNSDDTLKQKSATVAMSGRAVDSIRFISSLQNARSSPGIPQWKRGRGVGLIESGRHNRQCRRIHLGDVLSLKRVFLARRVEVRFGGRRADIQAEKKSGQRGKSK